MTRFRLLTVSVVTLNRDLLRLVTRRSCDVPSPLPADLLHRKNRQGLLMHLIRMHYARHEYGAVRKVGNIDQSDSNNSSFL